MNKEFELSVNPYDVLGVPHGCHDVLLLKKAYKKKSLILHPDNNDGLTASEFANLNKSYLYLKTLARELKYNEFEYDIGSQEIQQVIDENITLEERMKILQSQRRTGDFVPPSSKDIEIPKKPTYGSVGLQDLDDVVEDLSGNYTPSLRNKNGKINFEKQLKGDNSIIGDNFDADKVYQDMLKYRSTATKYRDISDLKEPLIENPFQGKKFNNADFNNFFEQKVKNFDDNSHDFYGIPNNIQPWGGFESEGATIVNDGRFMFVQGGAKQDTNYGVIGQFDGQNEKFTNVPDKVSLEEINSFMKSYESSGSSFGKLNKAAFNSRMQHMERQYENTLHQENLRNRVIIEEQIGKLSESTKANLHLPLRKR